MRIGVRRRKGSATVLAAASAVLACSVLWWPATSSAQVRVLRIGDRTAYLGVRMEDVTADNMAKYKLTKEMGVIVSSVEKGTPAEAAGIQENDVILEYCGIPVISATQLARLVEETPVGRKVELLVSRDGKRLTLTAKLAERSGRAVEAAPRARVERRWELDIPEIEGFVLRGPGWNRWFGLRAESRPRLGVTLEPLTDQMAEFLGVPGKEGALVTSVAKDSPADAKLRAGDVIVRADGKSVRNPDDLTRIIRDKDRGATIELRVIRDKKEITVSIQLDGTAGRSYKV